MTIDNLQKEIAVNRNQGAYKELFYLLYKPLVNFAFSLLGNLQAAEDAASDCLLKIWTMEQSLLSVSNLKAYAFRLIKNQALNQLKRERLYSDYLQTPSLESNPDPEKQLISKESLDRIFETIADLPPKCRMVFELVKFNDFSYQEAAEILEISVNTVNRHMQIALSRVFEAFAALRK